MNTTYKKDFITSYRKQLMTVALAWIGCFIVFFFAYLLLLAPQNKIKKRVAKELDKLKQEFKFASKATQEKAKIQLKEEIEQLQSKMKDFIIDFDDLANLTFDISRIASEKKISPFSIKSKYSGVSEIPNCKYIGENQIDIGFTASFDQFMSFLSDMERHQPVVFVDDLTLSRSTSDKDRAGLRISMSVAVFVRK